MTGKEIEEPGRYLFLFGGPRLEADETVLPVSILQCALLSVLAAHGSRGVPKERLLSMFWPEGTEHQLRRRLSQMMYEIRRDGEEPALIRVQDEVLFFNFEVARADLTDFLVAIRDRNPQPAVRILKRGFLPKLTRPPTHALERWISDKEVRFRADTRTMAIELWSECENRGAWQTAEDAARALLELDPLDEDAVERLVKALGVQGRAEEAEVVVKSYLELLRSRDSTAELSTRISSLLSRVKERTVAWDRRAAGRLPGNRTVDMIGRERELDLVKSHLLAADSGHFKAVLISGEAGIGKSRLAEETIATLPFSGIRVLQGRCSELYRESALTPLLDALSGAHVRDTLQGKTLSGVDHLLPAQRGDDRVREASPEKTDPAGEASHRLLEGFFRVFEALAEKEPVVLYLDDVQWVDETSLAVLDYVARRWSDSSLALLACARPWRGEASALAERFFQRLDREGLLCHVPLAELSSQAGALIVTQCLTDGARTEPEARKLVPVTGGVPLFLIEATLALERATPHPSDRETLPFTLPSSLNEIFASRVASLDSEARSTLELLAICSGEVPTSLGTRSLACSEADWWRRLGMLEERRLIRWGPSGVRVCHDLLRDYIRKQLPESRWRRLNAAVGRALERETTPDDAELALHFRHAGIRDKALYHATRAADQAESAGAYPEALSHLELGWRLRQGDPRRWSAGADYCNAAFRFQQLEKGLALSEEIQVGLRESGCPEAALQLEVRTVEARFRLGRTDAEHTLRALANIARQAREQGWNEVLLLALAVEAHARASFFGTRRMQPFLREVDRLKELALDPPAQVKLLNLESLHLLYGCPERGLTAARDAVSLALAHDLELELKLTAMNRVLLGLVAQGRADGEEGRTIRRRIAEAVEGSGDLLLESHPVVNEASWLVDCGYYEVAAEALSKVIDTLEATQARELLIRAYANRGVAHLRMGHFNDALEDFTRGLELRTPTTSVEMLSQLSAGQGLSHLRLGRMAEAKQSIGSVVLPDGNWPCDPALMAEALVEVSFLERRISDGFALLDEASANVRHRFPVGWIDLQALRVRLSLRANATVDSERLDASLALAESLGLKTKIASLRRLRTRAKRP